MSEYPKSLGGENGFEVGIEPGSPYREPAYTVRLPHQCGEWVVTAETDKAKAVAEMELFITEAQAALDKLRKA